jgi:hypothetical protein
MSSTIDTIRENATRANDLIKQLNDPTGDTTADETGGEQAPPAASTAPAPRSRGGASPCCGHLRSR